MIPKVIHYIWLGKGKYPKNISKCINSWYLYNPEFKIIKWDENNIPNDIHFVNYMIEIKQWAFASDCLRFWVLYHHGGIYLDTDMLVLKDLNPLTINNSLFFGKERDNIVSGGIIGSVSRNNLIKKCLTFYLENNNIEKLKINEPNKILIPQIITSVISEKYQISKNDSLEKFDNLTIYPTNYFYPISFTDRGKINSFIPSEQSYTVHLWNASWHNEYQNLYNKRYCRSINIFIKNLKTGQFSLLESLIFLKRFIFQIIKNNFFK